MLVCKCVFEPRDRVRVTHFERVLEEVGCGATGSARVRRHYPYNPGCRPPRGAQGLSFNVNTEILG
eukprot:3599631-Prymnesium_polylepis.1